MPRSLLFGLVLPFLTAIAGCGSAAVPGTTSATSATSIPAVSGDGGDPTDNADNDVSTVVGRAAGEWEAQHWLNSKPLSLASLRGRVVLVRWFMGTSCPMCSATAPSLRQLDAKYRARGLSVVGMYHHKDPEPLEEANVREVVRTFGFTFPVAIDEDWRTLKRWWLDGHERRRFTSVSFLIDKKGVVRHVHLGGRLAPTDADYARVEGYIETLLAAD